MARKSLPKCKRSKKPKPGPKPSITVAVVKRVGERFARGVPLEHALSAEANPKINIETWKKAMASNGELSPHWQAAKGKFVDWATKKLATSKQLKFLCWLLERRYPSDFAKPASVSVSVNNTTNISGVPDDVLGRARDIARAEAAAKTNAK